MTTNKDNQINTKSSIKVSESEGETCIWAILGLIFAFIFPLLGLIFSIMALSKIGKDPKLKGHGLAIAGLIVSIVLMIIPFLLIFFGVIAYFGVLNSEGFLPDRCILNSGASCMGTVVGDSVELTYYNQMGQDTTIDSLKLEDMSNVEYECTPKNVLVKNAESQIFYCSVPVKEGTYNKFNIDIEFYGSTDIKKSISGFLSFEG